jgi:hypothetical protein
MRPPKPACPAAAAIFDADESEAPAPSPEALLAGTLALMTGIVERAALALPLAAHEQSLLMAAKVRRNLALIAQHDAFSEAFRCTAGRLDGHWERLALPAHAAPDDSLAATEPALWHRTPGRLQ